MTKSDSSRPTLLRRARIITPEGALNDASLLLEEGRIGRIYESDEASKEAKHARAFDCEGLTVLPGFLDIHIHGAQGVDALEASSDDLLRVARFLATQGVTSWLPTLVPAPDEEYERAARAVSQLMHRQDEAAEETGARALGIHYEGPFVNERQCGALRTEFFRTYARPEDLKTLARVPHERALHMTTLAPEIEGGVLLIEELSARGWTVSIGHTRADAETLERAHRAGAKHFTHFMNAMPQLHHRAPGPVGFGLAREDVTCDIIVDGVHLDPLVVRMIVRSKTPERVALISDAVAPAGLGDGVYRLWGETIKVEAGRTRNERGSIAGSVITMSDAARLCGGMGFMNEDVARMASHVPARVLGIEKDYGSIEEGKRADLVVFDDVWNVKLTLVGGRVAFRATA